jgi:hypothetical protein
LATAPNVERRRSTAARSDLVATASAAHLHSGHHLNGAFKESVHYFSHRGQLLVGVDRDALLPEERQGTSAHATHHDLGRTQGGEQIHRVETSALMVGSIFDHTYPCSAIAVYIDQREEVAMAKVPGALCFEASWSLGGHSDDSLVCINLF